MVVEMVRNFPERLRPEIKSTAELNTRIKELEKLKDQMQAMGISIESAVGDWTVVNSKHDTNPFPQKMDIRDLYSEVEKLESTEGVDSSHAATAAVHKDWLDIKSVDISVQKSLSNLFSSKGKLKNEKTLKARDAFEKYCKEGEPRQSDRQADLIQICQI